MDAKEDILRRVRERLSRPAAEDAATRSRIRSSLAAPVQRLRPLVEGDLATRFTAMAQWSSSSVERVAAMTDAPAAAQRYLQAQGLPSTAVCAGDLAGLAWEQAGLVVEARAARDADLVGITGCYCAIAETGTLMMLSSPDSPAAVSLLPETHIALLLRSRLVAGMEEAWQLLRRERGSLPRAVNFISGPSRTGDIEQTIVLGAHGPYRVHIILVEA